MDQYFNGEYRTKSSRLERWDYGSNGKYFVTICTKDMQHYFGSLSENEIALNELGKHAENCWRSISERYSFVDLDQFIIMPNHIHGIIMICKKEHREYTPNKFGPQIDNLGGIIRGFKSGVSSFAKSNNICFQWQSRFFDRIIRNDQELDNIRQYITENPKRWHLKFSVQ